MSRDKEQGNGKFGWLLLCAIAVGATLWYTGVIGKASSTSSGTKREELYNNALAEAAASSAWPKTEQELITKFWTAIASGNVKQATLYCPGSTESDYVSYTRLKPSPGIRVGQGQPHPRTRGVTLWPSQVSFSYFGNKTIKLATGKGQSGQLIIDGKNTVWW